MLDLPTDKPEVVEKGFTALADFAGGLTLDPKEIDKERGVVIEEWRGGLGAGSRIRDKQIPVLYYNSRYAQRLPIGKPEILRTFPPARLRAFYDTWYRPDRMAVVAVGDIDPQTLVDEREGGVRPASRPRGAGRHAERKAEVPLHKDLLVSVVTDPEVTQSSVHGRPQTAAAGRSARRRLPPRPGRSGSSSRCSTSASTISSRKPDAKFLDAGVYGGSLSPDVAHGIARRERPGRQDPGGARGHRGRSASGRASSGSAPARWTARASGWRRSTSAPTPNATRPRAARSRRSISNYFLEGEPTPGIAYEYALVQQLLPGITAGEVSAAARILLTDESRVMLAVSPQKAGITRADVRARARAALTAADAVAVTAWNDTTAPRAS